MCYDGPLMKKTIPTQMQIFNAYARSGASL